MKTLGWHDDIWANALWVIPLRRILDCYIGRLACWACNIISTSNSQFTLGILLRMLAATPDYVDS